MIPRISPGKRGKGSAARSSCRSLASLVFVHFLGERMAGMNWKHAVILGLVLSLCAVVGDLIESIFKREAGVKDSGRFFPGIGGILDLLDSLLFNAPIMQLTCGMCSRILEFTIYDLRYTRFGVHVCLGVFYEFLPSFG